jgi:predicted phosphodiesterase
VRLPLPRASAILLAGAVAVAAATTAVRAAFAPPPGSLFDRAVAALRGAPAGAAPTILLLGDSGAASPEFRATLAAMARERALLALHGGDCTYRGPAEYGRFARAVAALPFPLVAVPGDHDREGDPTFAAFDRVIGGRDRFLDAGGVRVFLLDTSDEGLAASSLAALEAALADPARPPRAVVVTHCPPWQPGNRYPEGLGREHALRGPAEAARLVATLRRHRVSLLACGHWHAFADMRDAGFPVVVSGGGGSDLEPGESFHFARVVLADPVRVEQVVTAPPEGLGGAGRAADAAAYALFVHGHAAAALLALAGIGTAAARRRKA